MTRGPSTNAVWSQLSEDLRRFLRRRVGDDQTAEDLLQETFVRIHRNLASLNHRERLSPWVYKIARNVVNDHYRARSKKVASLDDADFVGKSEDRFGDLRCRSAEWLDELIGQLPEKYRDAVRWSEIDGLSQQEVATRLGLSLSGAKSRIQRGRAILRDALNQCCTFEFDRRGNLLEIEPKPDRSICKNCDDWNGAGRQ